MSFVGVHARGEMTNEEEFIFYVALLKATEHVEFRSYVRYDQKRVKASLHRLIKCVGWMHVLQRDNPLFFKLPRYVIDRTTNNLQTIDGWLNAWEDIKHDWTLQIDHSALRLRVRTREEALDRLVFSPRHPESYAKTFVGWAIAVSGAPLSWDEEWCTIFKANSSELEKIAEERITTMLEFAQENLTEQFGEVRTTKFLAHIRSQLRAKKLGIYAGMRDIGIGVDEIERMMDANTNPRTFVFADDQVVLEKRYKHLATETAGPRPQKTEFPDNVKYLIALNRWNIAQRMRAHSESKEALREQMI